MGLFDDRPRTMDDDVRVLNGLSSIVQKRDNNGTVQPITIIHDAVTD